MGKLLINCLISIGLSLLVSRLKGVQVKKLQPVLERWADVADLVRHAVADDEVKLEEAEHILVKTKAAIYSIPKLFE